MPSLPAPNTASISRRRVMLAGAATPFSLMHVSADGQTSRVWLTHHREMRRLLVKWGDAEADLARDFGWYGLTDDERSEHPGQALLDDIDKRIGESVDACDRLLPILTRVPARTRTGILLKMKVVAEVVDPVDQPDGHALIRSILRDLSHLFGQSR